MRSSFGKSTARAKRGCNPPTASMKHTNKLMTVRRCIIHLIARDKKNHQTFVLKLVTQSILINIPLVRYLAAHRESRKDDPQRNRTSVLRRIEHDQRGATAAIGHP